MLGTFAVVFFWTLSWAYSDENKRVGSPVGLFVVGGFLAGSFLGLLLGVMTPLYQAFDRWNAKELFQQWSKDEKRLVILFSICFVTTLAVITPLRLTHNPQKSPWIFAAAAWSGFLAPLLFLGVQLVAHIFQLKNEELAKKREAELQRQEEKDREQEAEERERKRTEKEKRQSQEMADLVNKLRTAYLEASSRLPEVINDEKAFFWVTQKRIGVFEVQHRANFRSKIDSELLLQELMQSTPDSPLDFMPKSGVFAHGQFRKFVEGLLNEVPSRRKLSLDTLSVVVDRLIAAHNLRYWRTLWAKAKSQLDVAKDRGDDEASMAWNELEGVTGYIYAQLVAEHDSLELMEKHLISAFFNGTTETRESAEMLFPVKPTLRNVETESDREAERIRKRAQIMEERNQVARARFEARCLKKRAEIESRVRKDSAMMLTPPTEDEILKTIEVEYQTWLYEEQAKLEHELS